MARLGVRRARRRRSRRPPEFLFAPRRMRLTGLRLAKPAPSSTLDQRSCRSHRRTNSMPRVLVSDKLSPTAVQIFKDRGVEVDYLPDLGKDKDKLLDVIDQYDGLAIRSATKVTEKLIDAATRLKVIGRAGIGVDNVDIPAASRRGIIVMNTPFGNSITTAEHAIALMFALARQIPEANASTHAGKVGEEPLHGRRDHRQDARRDRLRQYRLDRRHARRRPQDARHRLRPVPVGAAGVRARRREGRTGRAFRARRYHHAAHAADRQDPQHHRRRRRSPR